MQDTHAVYLVAATPRDCLLWQVMAGAPAMQLGVQVMPPFLPALAFDETSALVAAGSGGQGLPSINVYRCLHGSCFARASMPAQAAGVEDMSAVPACSFLRGGFGFVLAAVTQAGNVFLFDLRKARSQGDTIDASHETGLLSGAPFSML
eukprot:s846_g5.t1